MRANLRVLGWVLVSLVVVGMVLDTVSLVEGSAFSRRAHFQGVRKKSGKSATTMGMPQYVDGGCPNPPFLPFVSAPYIPETDETLELALGEVMAGFKQAFYDNKMPAASLVVVYNNQVLLNVSLGYQNEPKGILANSRTLYRIASNTKIFTAMMLYKMVLNGTYGINFNTPIVDIEPRYKPINPFNTTRQGTLENLASHMSGLPDETACGFNVACTTPEFIYEQLANLSLIYPPGYMPSYSNFGFAILGTSLQNLLPNNQTYEDYVTQNLLLPFGMASSGFDFTEEVISRMALGGGTSSNFTNIGWLNPAGGMFSCTDDLANFLMAIMTSETGGVFDPVDYSDMMNPRYVFFDGSAVALPWEMRLIDNYWARTKDGNFGGFSSNIAVVPELKFGVAFLSSNCCLDGSEVVDPILQTMIPIIETLISEYTQPTSGPFPTALVGNYYEALDGNEVNVYYDQEIDTLYADLNGRIGTLIWREGLSYQYYSTECPTGDYFAQPLFETNSQNLIFQANPANESDIIGVLLPGIAYWNATAIRI